MSRKMSGNHNPMAAVCQFTAKSDKEQNFNICKSLIEQAKNKGASMVFLPECYDFVGETRQQSHELAETMNGNIISRYKSLARSLKLWLSLGGGHEKTTENDKRVFNSHVIIDNSGDISAVYRKAHLFEVDIPNRVKIKESEFTVPGSYINPPVETPVGKLGLATCYDLRFPEFSLALTKMGADILTYPSAFTKTTGMAHWEALLRARAIENQVYIIAAAQYGQHNSKRTSYGHAMIVDPWGSIVASCSNGTDVAFAEIDLQYLQKVREEMPVINHRRTDLYPAIHSKAVPVDINAFDAETLYDFGQIQLTGDQLFHRTHMTMAFVNIKPIVPGHVLVSPLRQAIRFSDLTAEEVSDLFSVAQRVQIVIEKFFQATSCTISIQDGKDAGQSIEHMHIHIIPRKPMDFASKKDIYIHLQNHDKDEDRKIRSRMEMATEAASLRPFFQTEEC